MLDAFLSQIREKELAAILRVRIMDLTKKATCMSSPIPALLIIVVLHTIILQTAEAVFQNGSLIDNADIRHPQLLIELGRLASLD